MRTLFAPSTNYSYKRSPPSPKWFTKSRPPPFPLSSFTMSNWSKKDDQSTKSWGTPYVSPSVTWGTLPTTTSSSSCLQPGSPPNNIVVGSPQGWSSPLYPSMGSTSGAPSYVGMFFHLSSSEANWQVTSFLITPLGYPSPPVPSSTVSGSGTQLQLNPLLDSRSPQCLAIDIGAFQYTPNMNEPAVHPPVTYIQLLIVIPSFKWPVNIQLHSYVTVAQVVQHLFEFLQGYPNPHDLQKSKVQIPSGYAPSLRDQNPNAFHSGRRRIELLGPHRIFRGLSPDPRSNAWVVHLTDRWCYSVCNAHSYYSFNFQRSTFDAYVTPTRTSLTSILACVM